MRIIIRRYNFPLKRITGRRVPLWNKNRTFSLNTIVEDEEKSPIYCHTKSSRLLIASISVRPLSRKLINNSLNKTW